MKVNKTFQINSIDLMERPPETEREVQSILEVGTSRSGRQLKAQDAMAHALWLAAKDQPVGSGQGHLVQATQFSDNEQKIKIRIDDGSYLGMELETTALDTDFAQLPQKYDRVEIVDEWVAPAQTDHSWFQLRNLTTGASSLFYGKSIASKLELKGPDVLNISHIEFKPNDGKLTANFYVNGLRMNIEVPSNKMVRYYNGMPLVYKNEFHREESEDGTRFRIHASFFHPIEKKDITVVSDWYASSNLMTLTNLSIENVDWRLYPNSSSNYFALSWDVRIVLDDGAQLIYRAERRRDLKFSGMEEAFRPPTRIQILSYRQQGNAWVYTIKNLKTKAIKEFVGPLFWIDQQVLNQWR